MKAPHQPGECEVAQSHVDSYLDNELPAETTREVLEHMESCAQCARVLEDGVRVKAQLKRAVLNERAPDALRDRIRRDIRRRRGFGSSLNSSWMVAAAAAAVVVLAVAAGVFYRSSPNSNTTAPGLLSRNADVVPGDASGQILKVGFDDHVFCALDHKMADSSFTAEQMSEGLGPEFRALVTVVKDRLPQDYRIAVGHRCHYQNREFVHLILRRQDDVVSLIVTRRSGESLPPLGAAAVIQSAGVQLHEASWHNLHVVGMETRDHLVFVVSNMPPSDNRRIASSLAPAVSDFLRNVEV
jgi:mycothiol system anti-sigma-R factor